MKLSKKSLKGFTLVELIVVITILAILGTIAFTSLQGYSMDARDAKRLSDVNNIFKKITLEKIKGTSPSTIISSGVDITAGLLIGGDIPTDAKQGKVNFLEIKEEENDFKDPKGKDYVFSYGVGLSGSGKYNFVQLATINESKNEAVLVGDYYKIQTGDSESIVFSDSSDTNSLLVVDGNDVLPYSISNTVVVSSNKYPGCNQDDITIGSYKIAACNVGATISWTGSSSDIDNTYNQDNIYGKYFQWGRDKGFIYSDISETTSFISGITGMDAGSDSNNFVGGWVDPSVLWYTFPDDISNNWGNTTNTSIAREGPCATGYHVPSQIEWNDVLTIGGWGVNVSSIQTALKLPLAGYRGYGIGTAKSFQGARGYYRTSSTGTLIRSTPTLQLDTGGPSINLNNHGIKFGDSVRCFKN